MDGGIKISASRSLKPERKIIEKNRRNKMKKLFCLLYSLVPPHFISKGGNGATDKVDRTIEYIQSLKNNVEMSKKKKEKLLSKKRTQEHTTKVNNVCCNSLNIQVQEISHDLDAVLVTGLNDYSSFCDVVRLLGRYSAEVTLANYSSTGHSTFHIRQKQIEADDVCKQVKNMADGYPSGIRELDEASFCNEVEPDLSIWDFDFQSSVWGCELGVILKTNG